MSTEVKRRRGTTAEHASFTGAEGELTVDLTKDTVVVHDGATAGGFPMARESRSISTTSPLSGGGDLSADRTLTVAAATTSAAGVVELATDGESAANVAVQGNDSRMSNARTPTSHASSHQNGGGDEVATATAGANAIPKAGAGGTLAVGWYPDMVGDSGSGGTKGAVPAPGAGDAAAGKYLKADGTWTAPPAGGSPPTGTGFRHITAGVEDAAAKLVETADVTDANITYAKIQNISATDKVLGRATAGAGVTEEIACTAAGRALIDDATAGDQRTTLGLGSLATKSAVDTGDITDTAVTYAKIQNVTTTARVLGRKTAGAGSAEECTFSEVLDFVGSAAEGDIMVRGASAWSRLAISATVRSVLRVNSGGTAPAWHLPAYTKSITVESPTSSENITIFYTPIAITLTQVRAVVKGTTPSVTYNIKYGTDRSAAGTSVTTSPSAVTNETTGVNATLNNTAVAADSYIWFITTAMSGTVDEINVTLRYTED